MKHQKIIVLELGRTSDNDIITEKKEQLDVKRLPWQDVRGAGRGGVGRAWTGQAAATGGRAPSGTVTSTQVTRPQKRPHLDNDFKCLVRPGYQDLSETC